MKFQSLSNKRVLSVTLALGAALSVHAFQSDSFAPRALQKMIHVVQASVSLDSNSSNQRASPNHLSAAWANDGGNKIVRQGTPATNNAAVAKSSVWDGSKIRIFGAKNEVVNFNLVLEAAHNTASQVSVSFDRLDGPGGAKILSVPATGNEIFNYTKRDIELFFIRYLKIEGLSRLGYALYDERHIPKDLQRPNVEGVPQGGWNDRPNHDQEYPDIAVPLEAVGTFNIAQGQNQSIWSDIYIPKDVPSGLYHGSVKVSEEGNESYTIPVELTVHHFTLPDVPHSKTMLNLGTSNISRRYMGMDNPASDDEENRLQVIRDRHFQMAHRHKISLIDNNHGRVEGSDQPSNEWMPRLDGSLYSVARGYRGPGMNTGNGIFSIGTFGSAPWQHEGAESLEQHAENWANWFSQHAGNTEFFLYLTDETHDFEQIESWASHLRSCKSNARNVASMATLPLPIATTHAPTLQVVASTLAVGNTDTWDEAFAQLKRNSANKFIMYNGKRPSSGTFLTDDDGVALRELPWGQYKKGIDRWFYWESTYYKDTQGDRGDLDVMNEAQTFGGYASFDPELGKTTGNYGNGDGVLFYPGKDTVFTDSSYGLEGPIASLRLKHWRRGVQDVDYLTLAAQKDPARVKQIVNRMVGKVLWENGVDLPSDPTYKHCDIGWPVDSNQWEKARKELATIIESR